MPQAKLLPHRFMREFSTTIVKTGWREPPDHTTTSSADAMSDVLGSRFGRKAHNSTVGTERLRPATLALLDQCRLPFTGRLNSPACN